MTRTHTHLVVDGPRALQELPVRGSRGEVEGAGEDKQLAALGAHDHGELCVCGAARSRGVGMGMGIHIHAGGTKYPTGPRERGASSTDRTNRPKDAPTSGKRMS